jgi:RNAse (barnase) inhibitor barstar
MRLPAIAEQLAALRPPWVHLLVAGDRALQDLPPPGPGIVAVTLDGRRCRTKRALLDEVARAFHFPAYFGHTWDGLEDCLTDLTWLPGSGYRLVVTAADRLLARGPAHYATFVALLEDVGRAWASAATGHPGRAAAPFHTVLVVPPDRLEARPDWGVARLDG